MRLPTLLTAAGLLAVAALSHSQTPPPPPVPAPSPAGPPAPTTPHIQITPEILPAPVTPPAREPTRPVPPVTPPSHPIYTEPPSMVPTAEKSVDQLIAELEQLKTQKAQIEKQEQAVKDVLAKKLGEQNERLKKLGVEKKEEPKKTEADKPSTEPEVPARTQPLIQH